MGRPTGRRDATLERNENSIARGRTRQREYVEADRELRTASRDLDDAQDRVTQAERKICELHRQDEALCRRLHHENALITSVPA